ncbi:MAG: hypothetical protein M3220_17100 [Chloroflexota bacterium]|nr:hypothetical protein [Chloroflexota bacterium]
MGPVRHIVWIGVVVLLGFLASQAWAEPPPPSLSETEFGLAFINSAEVPRSDARIQRGIDAGARMDRFPLYWNSVEAQPNLFYWDNFDRVLRANEAVGLDTLVVLLGTSAHYYPSAPPASAPPIPLSHDGLLLDPADGSVALQRCRDGMRPPTGLDEPIFADGTDLPAPDKEINPANPWARFVHQAAERYRPGGSAQLNVRHWEIWNEPDLCLFWTGTPVQYARLLKVAYLVIKQVDPEAVVLWGGLAHYENPDFLPALIDTLKADSMAAEHNGFFDAAASHHYSDVTKGYQYTQRIRDVLAGTGWESKSVWITESGVPACGDEIGPFCPNAHRADVEGQASFIWQNVAYTRLAGGGPIFHFQLHDDCGNENRSAPPADAFGLMTNETDAFCVPHNAQPRLAYSAYQLATRYFPDTEILWEDTENDAVRRVAFYHSESSERRLLLWTIGTEDAVTHVPATGAQAHLIALDGSYVELTPVDGSYEVSLPGSTNPRQPNSATYIGGKPYLLIERDTLPPVTHLTLEHVSPTIFQLEWETTDRGSGVVQDGVTIWIQVDDGPWERWLTEQPASGSTLVQGSEGHRYRFGVIATDHAGNGLIEPLMQAETLLRETKRETKSLYLPFTFR